MPGMDLGGGSFGRRADEAVIVEAFSRVESMGRMVRWAQTQLALMPRLEPVVDAQNTALTMCVSRVNKSAMAVSQHKG